MWAVRATLVSARACHHATEQSGFALIQPPRAGMTARVGRCFARTSPVADLVLELLGITIASLIGCWMLSRLSRLARGELDQVDHWDHPAIEE